MTTTNSIAYASLELFDIDLGTPYNNSFPDELSKPIKYNRSRERTRVIIPLSKRRAATPYPRDTYIKAQQPNLNEDIVPYVEFDIKKYYSSLSPNRKEWAVGRHVCMSPRLTTKRMSRSL